MWKICSPYANHRLLFKGKNRTGICLDCAYKISKDTYIVGKLIPPTLNDILKREITNPKADSAVKEILEQLAKD